MEENRIKADYIFETSWEICNMVGGIHTVISTKALNLVKEYGDNLILIGPDVWKETRQNPEFLEDDSLFKLWREKAATEGLRVRTGRWNINGKPLVVLVDFTPFFPIKDKIFAHLWEKFKLDSISGGWDYIEPALFGYAAAQVIESYYNFSLSSEDKIIAQFHEWMTGTGILYLKEKLPQLATVFTTHATILGRSIAGNNLPLYSKLNIYKPDIIAKQFGVLSKYSLENLSAKEADAFTTVSEITARECVSFLGKDVDILTPNGFDDSFVPGENEFEKIRDKARKKLISVASAVLDQNIPDDSIFIINSGRYEFRNKGIDIFIDSISELKNNYNSQKTTVAFIAVPAGNTGPIPKVIEKLSDESFGNNGRDSYLTHYLHDTTNDPVLSRIRSKKLGNLPEDKVKIIFVPAYINESDAIFRMSYFDLLAGFDVSVFPSYYEPWGYTPLESIAFHIPTITTSLAGFGLWVRTKCSEPTFAVKVIDRTDDNDKVVTEEIYKYLSGMIMKTDEEWNKIRLEAHKISRIALWDNLIDNYRDAYSFALQKVSERSHLFVTKQYYVHTDINKYLQEPDAIWKKIHVKPKIPARISALKKISANLWWTWNYEALELFEMINPELWEKSGNNPIAMLECLSIENYEHLERSDEFLSKLDNVSKVFDTYINEAHKKPEKQIAYFSMEYGLHENIKTYSGGLGILAGDYLKQASDSNLNIVGIGLLYRYGYFTQEISSTGEQLSKYVPQKYNHLPLKPVTNENGELIKINIALPGRNLTAKVWRIDVGRIPLFLLDTDIDENTLEDRSVTHHLYGGDNENRFKQEMLLGVGGIRVLDAMNIKADIFHTNEGHAAFNGLERLRKLVNENKLPYEQALEAVRSSALFTTHTPVPAGHDVFDENVLRTYIPHYADRLNISWKQFMGLGRYNENDVNEKFSMSVLAAKLCQEINGVSRIHGRVSRKMFSKLYKGYFDEELHIKYVTNGVHYNTWTAKSWQKLHSNEFGKGFLNDQSNQKYWKQIHKISNENIWKIRKELKRDLIEFLRKQLLEDFTRRQEKASIIFKTIESLSEDILTIGFARRFATYKRANLLFSNLERLSSIVNNMDKPVQIVFAGKAHPNDKAGNDLIKRIIEVSRMPAFMGKIVFVENYDMKVARKLVQGVDVWMNTPIRPLEASGTSGQKAAMNGVLNFSVLDGWWAEGYKPEAGWAIEEKRTFDKQEIQDERDAEYIYNTLEEEIIPLYYQKNTKQIPENWIVYIKNSISEIAPHFTMKRMLDDYNQGMYEKLLERKRKTFENDFQMVKEIIEWKKKIRDSWDNIEILSVKVPNSGSRELVMGEKFIAEIVLDIKNLNSDDIGIQVIFGQKTNGKIDKILFKESLHLKEKSDNLVTFRCEIKLTLAGLFDYIFRVTPVSPFLQYPHDIDQVIWV